MLYYATDIAIVTFLVCEVRGVQECHGFLSCGTGKYKEQIFTKLQCDEGVSLRPLFM